MAIVLSATVCSAKAMPPSWLKTDAPIEETNTNDWVNAPDIEISNEELKRVLVKKRESLNTLCENKPKTCLLLNARRAIIKELCEKKPRTWICSPSNAILNFKQDSDKYQYVIKLYPFSKSSIKLLQEKPSTAVVFDAIYGGGDACEFIDASIEECIPKWAIPVETIAEKITRLFEDYQKGINVFCDKNPDLKDCWSPERLANEVITSGKFITKIDKNFIMTHENAVYICSIRWSYEVDKVRCHINPDE